MQIKLVSRMELSTLKYIYLCDRVLHCASVFNLVSVCSCTVHPSQPYPLTSTPRYDKTLPRSGTYPTSEPPSNPSPRSYTYDADFFGAPNRGVPVYPMPQPSSGSPYRTLPPPVKPKPMVSPNDDIQIPPTYSRQPRVPNGLRTLPPRYDDIMPRKERSDVSTVKYRCRKEPIFLLYR